MSWLIPLAVVLVLILFGVRHRQREHKIDKEEGIKKGKAVVEHRDPKFNPKNDRCKSKR